jgi:hypothetical protein
VKTLTKVRVGMLVAGTPCVDGPAASHAASAAIRSTTITDTIDAHDMSLGVHPHAVNREVAATVPYDGVRRDLRQRLVSAVPTE